jgi:hypothetical protein
MIRSSISIDHFYEVFPGHWLLLGSSTCSSVQTVSIRSSRNHIVLGSACLLDVPSAVFSKKSNSGDVKTTNLIAFFVFEGTISVSSLLINDHSIDCTPEPLSSTAVYWPAQLQKALKDLRVKDRSSLQLEKLLHSGLADFVLKGEYYWAKLEPWTSESFDVIKIGCQFGRSEITLVYIAQSSDHHDVLNWLCRLCTESWCVSGCVRVLIVAEQSCHPEVLKSELQKLLQLQQIGLEIVVPIHSLSLSDCVNLGVHLAKTELVLFDLSLSLVSLTNMMTCFSGLIALEPHKLIYPVLKQDSISTMSPPMLFKRQSFFELGGVLNLGSSAASVSQQMIRLYTSDGGHGARKHCDDQVTGFLSFRDRPIQDNDSSNSAWDLAFERCFLGG